jgi:hypothetical protein
MDNNKTNQEIFSTWKNQVEMSPSSIFSKSDVISIIDSISKAFNLIEGETFEGEKLSHNAFINEITNTFKKEILKNLSKLEDEGKYHDELMNFSQIVYNIEAGNVITVKDGVLIDLDLFETFLDVIKDNILTSEDENNNEVA